MAPPHACMECRAPLPPDAKKCPSCGAPVWPEVKPLADRRPTIAAFLLILLLGLAVFQGVYLVTQAADAIERAPVLGGPTFAIDGVVSDVAGAPIANATVIATNRNATATATDDQGRYRITNLSAGFLALAFNATGHGSAQGELFLFQDESFNVTLPAAGAPEADLQGPMIDFLRTVTQVCGGILLGIGLLCLAGAIGAYRRRNWGLAMTAAIIGIFVAIPFSLLVGAIAAVVLATSRSQFSR